MSSLGRKVSQIRRTGNNKQKSFIPEKFPIGIKTPLEKGYRDNETLFKMHFDVSEQIKDNLKNLIMTQKGERLGFPDFGTNLSLLYSNTNLTDDEIVELAVFEIQEVASKYMPSLRLTNFYSEKISDLEKGTNLKGQEFSNSLGQVSGFNRSNVTQVNKNITNKESVYKISINYGLLNNSEIEDSLLLYIKSAR